MVKKTGGLFAARFLFLFHFFYYFCMPIKQATIAQLVE